MQFFILIVHLNLRSFNCYYRFSDHLLAKWVIEGSSSGKAAAFIPEKYVLTPNIEKDNTTKPTNTSKRIHVKAEMDKVSKNLHYENILHEQGASTVSSNEASTSKLYSQYIYRFITNHF